MAYTVTTFNGIPQSSTYSITPADTINIQNELKIFSQAYLENGFIDFFAKHDLTFEPGRLVLRLGIGVNSDWVTHAKQGDPLLTKSQGIMIKDLPCYQLPQGIFAVGHLNIRYLLLPSETDRLIEDRVNFRVAHTSLDTVVTQPEECTSGIFQQHYWLAFDSVRQIAARLSFMVKL